MSRYLAALSAVCKWVWKGTAWLPSNPVLDVSNAAESAGIIRYLSDDERKALLAACKKSDDPNIATAIMLALATGARYSNIRNLTWADIDRKHGEGWVFKGSCEAGKAARPGARTPGPPSTTV